jgi:ribosomal protein S18 acetylase RimI-like enzyme
MGRSAAELLLRRRLGCGDWAFDCVDILSWNGTPCGYVAVEEHPDHVYVGVLTILPQFQNNGIGTQILKDAQERARRLSVPATLQVLQQNQAIGLYRRLGFQETGRTDTHVLMEWHGTR